MERLSTKTIKTLTNSATDSGHGNGVDVIDFVLPAGFVRWTLHVVPKDDGGGPAPDDPTIEVQYGIGSVFYSTNPSGTAVAVTNKDNTITRGEQVSKIQLKITNGATPPNKGLVAELYAARDVVG